MKKTVLLIITIIVVSFSTYEQNAPDSLNQSNNQQAADDPSQFITRVEVFNDLQHYKNENSDFYLNFTTFRTIVKIGKRFTTRLDVPYVYNSTESTYKNSGLGDISVRLLGYKFFESKKSAVTGSIECSFNTAESRMLGLGKNLIIPMITYSTLIPKPRMILAGTLQQANSIGGDETRKDVSFTKVQALMLNFWAKNFWTVFAPEFYFDYIDGGVSMNLELRCTYKAANRLHFWLQPGIGVFGDFAARYDWNTEVGFRYLMIKDKRAR